MTLQWFERRRWATVWQPTWLLALALATGVIVAVLPFPIAIAMVLGVASVLLILIEPLVGLALVLLAGPAGALENLLLGANLPESGQFLLLATLAAWILHGVLRRRLIIYKTPLNIPFAIFLTIAFLTLVPAISLSYGFKEVLKWLEMWLVMQMVLDRSTVEPRSWNAAPVNADRHKRRFDARWLMAILLIAALSQAFIGIWQFMLRGEGPEHFMILDRFYRAFGTFQQPNPYGGYMGMAACLAIGATLGVLFGLYRHFRARKTGPLREWLWLLFFGFCAAFTSIALVMSWSRGAWIGFAAGMGVLIVFLPSRRTAGLLLLVSGVAALATGLYLGLIPSSLSSRLVDFSEDLQVGDVRGIHITTENYAVIERLAHWQAGANMARQNLFNGVGYGNYEPAYEDYALLNWPHPLGHAHNYYLNVLAETGIFGALAYLAIWAIVFLQVIRLTDSLSWPQKGLALGLLAAWTALSFHHFFDKLYVNNLYLYFGAALGLQQVLALTDD